MDEGMDAGLMKIKQNEPYIAKVQHDQYFVVAERIIIVENTHFIDAMIDTICAYFAFDINYPKSLYPVLIFIQRYILAIRDNQPIPNVVTRVLTNLEQHPVD